MGEPVPIAALLISALILVPPFWVLLPRFGFPAPVALVAIIPLGAVILLWVMAIRTWSGGKRSF